MNKVSGYLEAIFFFYQLRASRQATTVQVWTKVVTSVCTLGNVLHSVCWILLPSTLLQYCLLNIWLVIFIYEYITCIWLLMFDRWLAAAFSL